MVKVRHYIIDAVFALLDKKEMSEITVTDVIKKAGVCRASFYRNYLSLEDVVKKYVDGIFERVSDEVEITKDNYYQHSLHAYQVLLGEKKHIKILEKRNLLYYLDDGYFDLCKKQIDKLGAYVDDYQIAFFAGSSAFIMRTWIEKDFKETPKELTDMISKMLVKIGSKE